MLPYGETITVVHPRAKGKFGDPGPGTDTPVEIPDCAVWPRGSTEQNFAQSTVIEGVDVLAPPGAVIHPEDRLIIGGETYQVDGRPFAWRSELTGTEAGVLVSATRVTG